MGVEWHELTKLTQGAPFTIERIRVSSKNISLEGSFDPPPLARLSMEDQIFVIAFVRCHGSIKEMEGMFGVSYPTVKNRLNAIAEQLEFVEINPPASKIEILRELEKGAMTVEEALNKLNDST
jgi:hypothetical protein